MAMAKKNATPQMQPYSPIFENYEIKSVLDIQALKDMFGGAMEQMLAGELDAHLGYDRHENATQTTNRRNGISTKTVRSRWGGIAIDIPLDSLRSQMIPKHQKDEDVSGIEGRVLAMYAIDRLCLGAIFRQYLIISEVMPQFLQAPTHSFSVCSIIASTADDCLSGG